MKIAPIFLIVFLLVLIVTTACDKQEVDLTNSQTSELTQDEQQVVSDTTKDIIDENEELDIGELI